MTKSTDHLQRKNMCSSCIYLALADPDKPPEWWLEVNKVQRSNYWSNSKPGSGIYLPKLGCVKGLTGIRDASELSNYPPCPSPKEGWRLMKEGSHPYSVFRDEQHRSIWRLNKANVLIACVILVATIAILIINIFQCTKP